MGAGGSSAGYSLVIGDPSRDREEVLQFCATELPDFTREHYSKYYEHNPAGPPAFVIARSHDEDRAVGLAALHPHELLVDGEVRAAAVAGDFVVAGGHRGLGPALALQRRLVGLIDDRGWSLAYGLPNRAAGAALKRVGYRELGPCTRFVRPLSLREGLAALRERSGITFRELWKTLPAGAGGRALRGHSIEAPASFDDRFEPVWACAARRATYVPRRTAALLDWKYDSAAEPAGRYSILAVAAGGSIAAYTVSHVVDGVRHLVDLGWLDGTSLRAMLAAEVARGGDEGLAAVDLLQFGRADGIAPALEAFGFFGVREPPIVAYASSDPGRAFAEPRSWELFEGAIDL